MPTKGSVLTVAALLCSFALLARPQDPQLDEDAIDRFLAQGELFEGDLKLPGDIIRQAYDLSSMPDPTTTTTAQNCSSRPNLRERRHRNGRNGTCVKFWPEGVVYYSLDPNVSRALAITIRGAMDEWEECKRIQFAECSEGNINCVKFTVNAGEYCYSDSVGMKGGIQTVNLPSSEYQSHGVILHLIGHVLGFWHEQSRPDRNNFVTIISRNVKHDRMQDLMKRSCECADTNLVYDYESIMHLDGSQFSKCTSSPCTCPTFIVKDSDKYVEQGLSLRIGQRDRLSSRDVSKCEVYYAEWVCPPPNMKGRLVININRGRELWPRDFDHVKFVQVTAEAVNSVNGSVETIKAVTSTVVGFFRSAYWNELFDMGKREWKPFFRIELRNASRFRTDLSDSSVLSVEKIRIDTPHREMTHCIDPSCQGYIQYSYTFTEDTPADECSSNPCQNGGTCTAGTSTYTCTCPDGWLGRNCHIRCACCSDPCQNGATCNEHTNYITGTSTYTCSCLTSWIGTECSQLCPCQNGGTCSQPATVINYQCLCPHGYLGTNCETQRPIQRGTLRVYVRYGIGLRNEDSDFWNNYSDPYVIIVAYDFSGGSVTRTSSVDQGDQSPEWNEWLNFPAGTWDYFKIRVYDEDLIFNDPLSDWEVVNISPGSSTSLTHSCYSGYIIYDYSFN